MDQEIMIWRGISSANVATAKAALELNGVLVTMRNERTSSVIAAEVASAVELFVQASDYETAVHILFDAELIN